MRSKCVYCDWFNANTDIRLTCHADMPSYLGLRVALSLAFFFAICLLVLTIVCKAGANLASFSFLFFGLSFFFFIFYFQSLTHSLSAPFSLCARKENNFSIASSLRCNDKMIIKYLSHAVRYGMSVARSLSLCVCFWLVRFQSHRSLF